MKAYVLFFNAPTGDQWDDDHEPYLSQWCVGVLEQDGYRHAGCFDCGVETLSHHETLDAAVAALRTLVQSSGSSANPLSRES